MKKPAHNDQRGILIIEESIDRRVALKVKLGSLGCEVYVAANYDQAIHTLQERELKMVLASEAMNPSERMGLSRRISRLALKDQPRLFDIGNEEPEPSWLEDCLTWQDTDISTATALQPCEPQPAFIDSARQLLH